MEELLTQRGLLLLVKDLQREVQELRSEVAALKKENAELKKENQELKSKLAKYEKDSSNSSKPPSKDKESKKGSKGKSGKKPGGQKGHKGHAREHVKNPDKVEKCEPEKCSNCGLDLSSEEGTVISKRQEVDVIAPEPEVTEFQQIQKICPHCNTTNTGKFPENIKAHMQIGNNAKALAIYLHVNHKIPFKRTTNVIDDLLGLRISDGSIENFLNQAYEKTKDTHSAIMEKIKAAEYLHSDETGIRVDKKLWQLWTWCSKDYTYYHADKRRSTAVIEENLGTDYKGVAIHDCHSAQNNTKASKHQHCLVHYDRDLRFAIETENCKWSEMFYHFTLNARRIRDSIWHKDYPTESRVKVIESFHKALKIIMEYPPLKKEGWKLYKRVMKHSDKILTFMDYPDLPADNNAAERAIRNAKIQRKVSGCFRNILGAKRYAVILSWIETAKKLNQNALLACQNIFLGNSQLT